MLDLPDGFEEAEHLIGQSQMAFGFGLPSCLILLETSIAHRFECVSSHLETDIAQLSVALSVQGQLAELGRNLGTASVLTRHGVEQF